MRRAVARGRMVPQSLSTDPRMGQLSLKAALLYDRLWINADDQGRLSGNPNEIKYATCPNVDQIAKSEIPELLKEMEEAGLIKLYTTSRQKAIQMLDWWEEQKLQWAWPSRYPPPEGWKDRLRYKKSAKEVVTENWGSPESSPESSPENTPEPSPETSASGFLTTSSEKERGRGRRRGRGKSPEGSGERSPPSPSDLCTDRNKIINKLVESFRTEWGRVPAESPGRIIPREPTAKERAQIRDLAKEISAAGGCPLSYIREAFREAAGQEEKSKKSVWYVRAILFDWLGYERVRPP